MWVIINILMILLYVIPSQFNQNVNFGSSLQGLFSLYEEQGVETQ